MTVGWDELARLSAEGVSPESVYELARRHGVFETPDVPEEPTETEEQHPRLDHGEPVYADTWRDLRIGRQRTEGMESPDAAVWAATFAQLEAERWTALADRFEQDMRWENLVAAGRAS